MLQTGNHHITNNEDAHAELEALRQAAWNEKMQSAERNIVLIRIAVILINIITYFFTNQQYHVAWLADTIVVVALLYGIYLWAAKPYEKYPAFFASYLSYIGDAVLIALWVYATGGYHSPYFIVWYVSIVAVAFRYSKRAVILTSVLYSLCYVAILLPGKDLELRPAEVIIRCLYIFLCGYLGALITTETYEQTHEKLLMQRAAEELSKTEQELIKKTDALKGLNNELEVMVQERTRELEEAANRFKNMLDSVPLIAWTTDTDGRINYRNKYFYDFVGVIDYSRGDIGDFIDKDDVGRVRALWAKVKNTGEQAEIEYRWKRYDGQLVWMLGRVVAIRNANGEILMWIGTATDINEQKKTIDQKDQFIGVASHELKTPLTSIKAYAQLVEQSLKSEELEAARIFIRKTDMHIGRMEGLIDDLLDVSKMQGGRMVYNMAEFDFNAMAAEAIESMQHIYKSHTIKLEHGAPAYVFGDKQRIEQVLDNLVVNAIKYSPGAKEVHVSIANEKDAVHVTVQDYGLGIPKDKAIKIFDRFYRANETSTISGLGLGLFIAKEIITRHHGKIWVVSDLGKGSAFHFTIPYKLG